MQTLDNAPPAVLRAAAGIPSVETTPQSMSVAFQAHRFTNPRMAWLNTAWWQRQAGLSPEDRNSFDEISSWLLSEFACTTVSADLYPNDVTADTQTLYADRYGGPSGSDSGGSGRCGARGSFNAKGCGPTPLVGRNVSWYHSHGCLFLEEAVREAIYASVASDSFPHGAQPVVAIIDTGSRFMHLSPEGKDIPGARRAILVRPNFLRPASLQRSIFFGLSGTPTSEQYLDAVRVRDAVRTYASNAQAAGLVPTDAIACLFESFAEQVGAGWAHRLSHDYFASNLTMCGQLVDFGNFRAVPSWRRTEYFGREMGMLTMSLDALSFYFRKYAPPSFEADQKDELVQRLGLVARTSFCRVVSQMADESRGRGMPLPRELPDLCWSSFQEFQSQDDFLGREHLSARRKWWFTSVGHPDEGRFTSSPGPASSALLQLLRTADSRAPSAGRPRSMLHEWLMPRRVWYRERVLQLCQARSTDAALASPSFKPSLDSFISTMATAYRHR